MPTPTGIARRAARNRRRKPISAPIAVQGWASHPPWAPRRLSGAVASIAKGKSEVRLGWFQQEMKVIVHAQVCTRRCEPTGLRTLVKKQLTMRDDFDRRSLIQTFGRLQK